jgi:thioredoxin-related protein
MKKWLFLLLVVLGYTASGQVNNSRQEKVPPFRILKANKTIFRAEDLPFGKAIMIIYFSPDCEECQKLTHDLLSRIDDFRKVSIAMITYQPVENVDAYVRKNNLDRFSNIYPGTEGSTLFVRNYYNIVRFPFIALYTSMGDLVKKYTADEIDLEDVSARLNSLK